MTLPFLRVNRERNLGVDRDAASLAGALHPAEHQEPVTKVDQLLGFPLGITGPRAVPVSPQAEESVVAAIARRDAHSDEPARREKLNVGVIPGKDRLEVPAVGRRKPLFGRPPDHCLADAGLRRQPCHPPHQQAEQPREADDQMLVDRTAGPRSG